MFGPLKRVPLCTLTPPVPWLLPVPPFALEPLGNPRAQRAQVPAVNPKKPSMPFPSANPFRVANLCYTARAHRAKDLVFVRGVRSRRWGPVTDIPLPVHTRLLDARGGRVTPGLIDLGGRKWRERARSVGDHQPPSLRVSVRNERDLRKVRRITATLSGSTSSARILGLHVRGAWPQRDEETSHWPHYVDSLGRHSQTHHARFRTPGRWFT